MEVLKKIEQSQGFHAANVDLEHLKSVTDIQRIVSAITRDISRELHLAIPPINTLEEFLEVFTRGVVIHRFIAQFFLYNSKLIFVIPGSTHRVILLFWFSNVKRSGAKKTTLYFSHGQTRTKHGRLFVYRLSNTSSFSQLFPILRNRRRHV